MGATANLFGAAFTLPSVAVSLIADDRLDMLLISESRCTSGADISPNGGSCGLQVEFLYSIYCVLVGVSYYCGFYRNFILTRNLS